ncbi:Tex family protein [Rothia amarae]|uniref:Tex family protein n=1 Tax=Rothia amarae TaxID=169480 RepID=UPI0012450B89
MTSASTVLHQIESALTGELGVELSSVRAVIELLDSGATVPFIARYRKEKTGGLSDVQLRLLQDRLGYLRELEDRRSSILQMLTERGVLEPSLKASVLAASTKNELESLYAPYKVARRTKAQIALEAGLEPLVDDLLEVPLADLHDIAAAYIHPAEKGAPDDTAVPDTETALAGARAILHEYAVYDHELMDELREKLWNTGVITSKVVPSHRTVLAQETSKFSDYYDFSERIRKIPSHRLMALMRAEKSGEVKVTVDVAEVPGPKTGLKGEALARHQNLTEGYETARASFESAVAFALGIPVQILNTVSDDERVLGWLAATVRSAWRQKVLPRLAADLRTQLTERAEKDAAAVFASNLRDLLLAAPAGNRTVLGLDPGLRTGVKIAVVSPTGAVLDTAVIYPHAPQNRWDEALDQLETMVREFKVELLSIGNGTASRDTDRLAGDLLKRLAQQGNDGIQKVTVSEAGASVYSASALATEELPDMDVSLRGAVSIARRLQDPLAELVKIDPQSIGVGQYQHDIPGNILAKSLDATVEDCVNAVGVWVNSASPALLSHVAGINATTSEAIVKFREENGAFSTRQDLLKVPRLGPKAFEQAAGFIRIADGSEPLDASGVHPEAYDLARAIVHDAGGMQGSSVSAEKLAQLKPEDYVSERFGLPTVRDIFAELERPGRDPRPDFQTAEFTPGVETIDDVAVGMILEGTVSNVAAFGAFVDIGVHQDGLVHISQMSTGYVDDPHKIVRSGDVVKVRVTEVNAQRGRIALSLLLEEKPAKPKHVRGNHSSARTNASKPGGARKGSGVAHRRR